MKILLLGLLAIVVVAFPVYLLCMRLAMRTVDGYDANDTDDYNWISTTTRDQLSAPTEAARTWPRRRVS